MIGIALTTKLEMMRSHCLRLIAAIPVYFFRSPVARSEAAEPFRCVACENSRHADNCKHKSKSPEEVLKQIMLELLYPAVLGAVLFEALKLAKYAYNYIRMVNIGSGGATDMLILKCILVALTVFFYGCDYAYIILTRHFQVWFFWLDCGFLIGLYITFVKIHADAVEIHEPPEILPMTVFFVFFAIAYFLWDLSESRTPLNKDEVLFYCDVLIWELLSLLCFCAVALIAVEMHELPWRIPVGALLGLVLLFVNVRFFNLVKIKRTFSTA